MSLALLPRRLPCSEQRDADAEEGTNVYWYFSVSVVLVDFNRVEVYEAGAMLLSVLACPGDREEEMRAGVHASLCRHGLRVICANNPDWALSPQPMKPIYALRTSPEVRAAAPDFWTAG